MKFTAQLCPRRASPSYNIDTDLAANSQVLETRPY